MVGSAQHCEPLITQQGAPLTTPALEARGLSRRFGDRVALQDLTLTVATGEIFCLLGPNGAGKTTTINLFLGFLAPSAGAAFVHGRDVVAYPLETKRRLAYLPEQVALYPTLTGAENLRFFASLSPAVAALDVPALFAQVGLDAAAADHRLETYSKGMRQKVGLAIALATEADVFLLDEPTSGLDPSAANELGRLLESLRARGAAVLMATHDLYRARAVGTRIGIMHNGRLRRTFAARDFTYEALEAEYLAVTGRP